MSRWGRTPAGSSWPLTACCKILVFLKINDALIGEFGSTQHPAALVCVPSQHSPVRADAFPPTPPLPTVPDGPAAAGCTPRPTDRLPAGSSTGPRAALCATHPPASSSRTSARFFFVLAG